MLPGCHYFSPPLRKGVPYPTFVPHRGGDPWTALAVGAGSPVLTPVCARLSNDGSSLPGGVRRNEVVSQVVADTVAVAARARARLALSFLEWGKIKFSSVAIAKEREYTYIKGPFLPCDEETLGRRPSVMV